MLEELGLTEKAQNMTTWEEYEEILQAFTDANNGTGMYAVGTNGNQAVVKFSDFDSPLSGEFTNGNYFDTLGDATYSIEALDDGTVIPRYNSDNSIAGYQKLVEWNEKGFIYPDAAYDTSNTGSDQIKTGLIFSYFVDSEYGLAAQFYSQTGIEVVTTELAPCYVKTSTVTAWGIALTCNAQEPEAAAKFVNLMYTDEYLINLLQYGVEGEDYVYDGSNASYPNDDADSVNWHGSDWLFGNQFLVYPWSGYEADYREICKGLTEEAPRSPYMGFTLDSTDLTDEIAGLSAVFSEYSGAMNCGGYTEDLYNDYCAAMDAAGVSDYIEAINTQLAAWNS